MSEQFYSSTLKKRRKGQRMNAKQRIAAQAMFLSAYERSANILAAAEQAEIDRTLVYYWQEHDEQFGFAFNIADEAANKRIEAEIRRRAMEGVLEPVISQGQLAYDYEPVLDDDGNQKYDSRGKPIYQRGALITVRKYSDVLLMFYAKRRMPEYRDKQHLDVKTTNTNVQDMQAIHAAIAQSLASYPDAKIAVAEALVQIEKTRERNES